MRRRTKAREFALQILYQIEIAKEPPDTALENFWETQAPEHLDKELKDFTAELVEGVRENLGSLDAKITQYAANWELKRMAAIDRNILRLSAYELMFRQDIPPKVSINEAVELAKKYSGLESGKFVNAILDKIKQELNK